MGSSFASASAALLSRRELFARCALLLLPSLVRGQSVQAEIPAQLSALETSSDTRIGLAALDTGSGHMLLHRADERFLFCSTWKLTLVAALLARVDRGHERLSRRVQVHRGDLLAHSPVTALHAGEGMTLEALCAAAMTVSDNAAANLLLIAIDGLAGYNAYVRSLGDQVTRLDRNELALNVPDGEKDTTTPRAMLGNLHRLLLGDALQPVSRQRLLRWMNANTTGDNMLRAGLPASWKIGDKTGHGDTASNDLAIVTPPGRAPILIAAYTTSRRNVAPPATLMPAIGRLVAQAFTRAT